MTEQANKKVLILGEYPRLDHYKNDVYDYFNTQMGRTLKAVVKEYAGITAKDFTYLNACKFVPDVLQERRGKVIKYKEPTITEMQKGRAVLDEEGNIQKDENGEEIRKGSSYMQTTKEILELKPDIVVPTGKLGVKLLLDISSITKARGVPVKTTIEHEGDSHTFWVLPTLSIEYVTVRPNLERQVASDFMTLSKYLKQGDKAFEAGDVKYELVTTIERVREIFNNDIKQQYDDYKIVAWDTETNTLQPDKEGSKILVLTMTWKFGQGVTIPIHKTDFEWPNGEQDVQEIMQLWKDWLADKNQQKVAHNCNYDENVLRHVAGFTDIESVQDTKVGWYLAVSQESAESLRLSDLAYEVTDMGGYDTPLESFKKWYKGDLLKYLEKEIKEKVKENKKLAKKVHGVKATEYKQWLEDNIDTTQSYMDVSNQFIALDLLPETMSKTSLLNSESFKEIVEKSPEYMSLSDNGKAYVLDNALEQININKEASKVRNLVDDSTFDYDWIPLELMHPYASGDTDCCRRIYTNVRERLKDKPKLEYLLTTSYPRLERTLTKMQYNGLHLDVNYAVENDKVYEDKLKEVEDKIANHWSAQEVISEKAYLYQLGVEEFAKPPAERDKVLANYRTKYKPEKQIFNPGSIDDKAKLLFEVLGMELPYNREFIKKSALDANKPEDKITTKDYKTDKKVIAHLAKSYPEHQDIMGLLLAYSDYSTVRSTFTSGFLERYNKNTNKLHGTYNSAGTECVTGDTLLITSEGIKEIQSLSDMRQERTFEDIDIFVANRYGKEEKANAFYYNGVRNGYKVTLEDGTEIITTPNHPLLKNTYYKGTKHVNYNNQTAKYMHDFSWTKVEDLQVGDYLKQTVGSEMYGSYKDLVIEGFTYSKLRANTNTKLYTLPTIMNEELAEWYGMYTADGSYSTNNGSFSITLTNNSLSVRARFAELTQLLFNVEAKFMSNKDRSPGVEFSSIGVGAWLREVLELRSKALDKTLPNTILESPKSVQQAFLRGLTLDSATDKKKYPSLYFNTVSKDLALRVRAVLMNMGIYCRISMSKAYKENAHKTYSVQLTYDNLEKFTKEIGFVDTTKLERVVNCLTEYKCKGKYTGTKFYEDVVMTRIKSIELVEQVEFFDLHVPNTHSFTGNSLVNHNTGRLSSRAPNLQNLPRKSTDVKEFGYKHPVKRTFTSSFENGALIQADYSALEMRIIALFTKDEGLTQAFLDGEDVHKATASIVFGKPMDEVTDEERTKSKAVNQMVP